MRAKSQWTPGGIALWLIAAILATLLVCNETEPGEEPRASPGEVEIEVVE
jgi:hypothetical protein